MAKRARTFSEREVRVSGALTGATLRRFGSEFLFRPHRNSGDIERLTWEVVPPPIDGGYAFVVHDLSFATAEGAAGLAATVSALRRHDVRVTIDITDDNARWATSLGIERLASVELWPPADLGREFVPLHVATNESAETRAAYVQQIASKARALLKASGDVHVDEKAEALALVAREVLLNVAEHAYLRGKSDAGPAFVAMTATRAPLAREVSDVFTAEESEWFAGIAGRQQYLEIAIADCGTNIPYTLGEQFATKFPKAFRRLRGSKSRGELHREIALWAFHHQSSRRRPDEFATTLARLNWRGLHTALRRAADHNGAIIMQTGLTRLGYTCSDGQPHQFSHDVHDTREFPGTIVTLRLPISRRSSVVVPRLKTSEDSLRLHKLVPFADLERSALTSDVLDSAAPLGIVVPFQAVRHMSEATNLRVQMEILPPHIVPIFMPAHGVDSAWVGLAAFESEGAPRLAGVAMPGTPIDWKIVGIYPPNAASVVKSLEQDGFAMIGDDEMPFAQALRHAYPEQITFDGGILRNERHGWQIADESASAAMQMAFDLWYAANVEDAQTRPAPWLFGAASEPVLLRTGKYVKRYISVMRLLESNELLARAVAWKLVATLKKISGGEKPFIVADSEASYFRLATLLRDVDEPYEVSIRRVPGPRRAVVLFADAVYKGDTVRTLMREVPSATHVIACLDIAPQRRELFDIPFTGLLRVDFEPAEFDPTPPFGEVLECDAVTNVPEPKAATERFEMGTSAERQQFLKEHPELLRHGLQRAGGRTHTLTLPCQGVLRHRDYALKWILERLIESSDRFPERTYRPPLVLFYRNDAEISRIITYLAALVDTAFDGVFGVPLPFVAVGSREAFARATPHLLSGIRRLGTSGILPTRPMRPYVALYVDDACVTGRTLFNFLVRAGRTSPDERPLGVVVVPVVSRLSPAEEYFFSDLCSHIGGGSAPERPAALIPFVFVPLFRLQVGSLVPADAVPINHFLTDLRLRLDSLDDRSRVYAETVLKRADRVFRAESLVINESPVVAHPLYTGNAEGTPPSFRAVRIRQLVSLHEQNIGVLGELLHEFYVAFEENDFSVLSILALEPRLLNLAPLRDACWRGISNLAALAIRSSESDAVKSDALAVLAFQGDALARSLHQVLPAIGGSRPLIEQLVVSLYELRTNVPKRESLAADCAEWPPDEQRYLWRTLASIERLGSQWRVTDETTAWNEMISLLSRIMFHAQGQERLTSFQSWLQKEKTMLESTSASELRTLTSAAIAVVDATLRPALDVLEWLARRKGDVDVVRRIRHERPQLIHATSELQVLAATVTRTVGKRAEAIAAVWDKIQRHSLTRAAELILYERDTSVVGPDSQPPLIEDVLPRYVCWPTRILAALARLRLSVTLGFAARESSLRSIVVAPCPLGAVTEAFDLIIGDMLKHGTPGSHNVTAAFDPALRSLTITFTNLKRQKDVAGTRRSQKIVSDLAEDAGFAVRFDPQVAPGEPYSVVVEFPRTFRIEMDRFA